MRAKIEVGQTWAYNSGYGSESEYTIGSIKNNGNGVLTSYTTTGAIFLFLDKDGYVEVGSWKPKDPNACDHDCCKTR
jgi:hypothetical protein